MNKLREKLKQKKKELEGKINKNRRDIKILNDNLSFFKDKSDLFSFAGMAIPFVVVTSLIPMSLFLEPIVYVCEFCGLFFVSRKIKKKIIHEKDLRKMMYGEPTVDLIVENKCKKEIEIEKNKNFQKVVSNVCDNIESGKKVNDKEEYNKEDLLNAKKDIEVLSTQKFLKENYANVKETSVKKSKILDKTSLLTACTGIVSIFCFPTYVTVASVIAMLVQENILFKNNKKLYMKNRLLCINDELDEDSLSLDELGDNDISCVENKINKKINAVSDAIYVNSMNKEVKETKEKSLVHNKTNEKEMTYDLFFERDYKKEKPKVYKLTK